MAESDAIIVRGRKNLCTKIGESREASLGPEVAIHSFHSFLGRAALVERVTVLRVLLILIPLHRDSGLYENAICRISCRL